MTFFYDLNKKLAGIADKSETKQLNESAVAEAGYSAKAARAGKDIGQPGKNFEKIAKSAGERYGSKERGEKVAGAVLAKLRAKEGMEEGIEDRLKDLDPKNPVNVPAYQRRAASGDKPVNPPRTPSKGGVEEGMMDTVKATAQKALDVLGHGDDQDMIRDLQRKAGVPVTGKVPAPTSAKPAQSTNPTMSGQQPMSEDDVEEGNRFTYNLKKARDAGKTRADLDGDGDLEPVREAAKPDYIDLDKDGNRKESMKKAAADKKAGKKEVDEGWDDMMKDVERRSGEMKKGEKIKGHKGEIEKTATGIRHTRSYDAKTGETDTGDDDKPAGEKRGRGRPKKTDKAPERVTAKAYKHKGSRKMSNEEIEEAIAALEEAGYSISKLDEKAVTVAQRRAAGIAYAAKKGEIPKSELRGASAEMAKMPKGELAKFAKTKEKGLPKKKEESVEETTVAGSVAPAADAPKSKAKGGMTFGKGIYDSLNRELESMIAESMNVSVNMNRGEDGQSRKSITVSAEGEAAEQLAQLLNLAGLASKSDDHGGCGCDTSPCSCEQMVDENAPDWPTNTETGGEDDPHLQMYSGGLNGPKSTGQTVGAPFNRQNARQGAGDLVGGRVGNGIKEDADLGMNLYREYKNYKAK